MCCAATFKVFYVLCLTKIINIFYQMVEITSCASATCCGILLCCYRTLRMFKSQELPLVISTEQIHRLLHHRYLLAGHHWTQRWILWYLLGRPRGMVWGGRREEGSGWGTHVYLWQIHFDIWQNQYNIVKLNKIKLKKKRNCTHPLSFWTAEWITFYIIQIPQDVPK